MEFYEYLSMLSFKGEESLARSNMVARGSSLDK